MLTSVCSAGDNLISIPTIDNTTQPLGISAHPCVGRPEPVALPESPFITLESIVAIMEAGALTQHLQ
jgi:hypothetical protein